MNHSLLWMILLDDITSISCFPHTGHFANIHAQPTPVASGLCFHSKCSVPTVFLFLSLFLSLFPSSSFSLSPSLWNSRQTPYPCLSAGCSLRSPFYYLIFAWFSESMLCVTSLESELSTEPMTTKSQARPCLFLSSLCCIPLPFSTMRMDL